MNSKIRNGLVYLHDYISISINRNHGFRKNKEHLTSIKKQLKISTLTYITGELWYLQSNNYIPTSLARARKNAQKNKAIVMKVSQFANCSVGEAIDKLYNAKCIEISNQQYVRYQMWDLSAEEISEFSQTLQKLAVHNQEKRTYYINLAAERSGKTQEEISKILDTYVGSGLTAYMYVWRKLYLLDENALGEYLSSQNANEEEDDEEGSIKLTNSDYLKKICQTTGWTPGKAELEITKARVNSGASYKNYYYFRMHELTPDVQRTYITRDNFVMFRVKYNDPIAAQAFCNKASFNRLFSDFIHRKWFINKDVTYEQFLKYTSGISAVMYKPMDSSQGKGITKYELTSTNKQKVYNTLANLPRGLVEEFITQHDSVKAFCDTSVNTIRVMTLNANGKCNFLHAVFRMGCGKVVDNFHAGGVGAIVDVETGLIVTHASDLEGNVYPTHPYSGLDSMGFQIPNWEKVRQACEAIYNRVPNLNMIGWDFAITPDGFELVEGNSTPYYLSQSIWSVKKIGRRAIELDPYL